MTLARFHVHDAIPAVRFDAIREGLNAATEPTVPDAAGVDGISRYAPSNGVDDGPKAPRIAPSNGARIDALTPCDGAMRALAAPLDGVSDAF